MKEYFKEQIEDQRTFLKYVILKFELLENGLYEISQTIHKEFTLSNFDESDFSNLIFARIQNKIPVFRLIDK